MVQTFFERSFAINRLRQGPLAGHIDLLAAQLATHGYSRVHSRIQLRLVGHFNRWLEQKDLTVAQIDEEIIERYWRYFMRKKKVRSKGVCALMKLLDLLREKGVTPRTIVGRKYRSSRHLLVEPDRLNGLISLGRSLCVTAPDTWQHGKHKKPFRIPDRITSGCAVIRDFTVQYGE